MKITFVLPIASLSGGVRVVSTYARTLTAMGHEVTVVSQPRPNPDPGRGWKRLRRGLRRLQGHRRKTEHRTPLLEFLGPAHVVLDRPRPITEADVPDADAIIATWWETANWVAALPATKGRKFYLLQDYEAFDGQPRDQVAATFHLPLQKLAVSHYIADTIARLHDAHDTIVVPNATDTEQFDAPPRERNRRLTVGFLYTASPRKRVSLAIDSVVAARQLLPDLRVLAFGANAPAAKLPLPGWIEYRQRPTQTEIPEIYAACDLWLFTSAHEGFGLPILEAMACRTPVLATAAGAAPQIVNGENGLLVPGEAEQFAARIAEFSTMPATEWRRFSAASHHTAHSYTYSDATALLLRHLQADAPSAAVSTP